jgi:hypothetical protein
MASFVNNLIEYAGIADSFPSHPTSFKQFTVQETLELPCAKPDIEQITRVMANVKITSTRVIKTPDATSAEGQILTGWKLIVEGELIQKVEYVADEPTQSVHAAHFSVPFSTFIVLPKTFTQGSIVNVVPYIEDIYAQQIGKRCIFKNVTIFLNALI